MPRPVAVLGAVRLAALDQLPLQPPTGSPPPALDHLVVRDILRLMLPVGYDVLGFLYQP